MIFDTRPASAENL